MTKNGQHFITNSHLQKIQDKNTFLYTRLDHPKGENCGGSFKLKLGAQV